MDLVAEFVQLLRQDRNEVVTINTHRPDYSDNEFLP